MIQSPCDHNKGHRIDNMACYLGEKLYTNWNWKILIMAQIHAVHQYSANIKESYKCGNTIVHTPNQQALAWHYSGDKKSRNPTK